MPGEKTYDTHVAWGLLEAARVTSDARYADAALANVAWARGKQSANGWFAQCCLSDPLRPLTHTLGYALRGVLEAYLFAEQPHLLAAARSTAEGLLSALRPDGWLPGRLDANWQAAADWVCVTGSSQVAYCWLRLFEITGDRRYLDAGRRTNAWVRRTIRTEGPPETRGAVKGCFPIDGGYGTFEFLNWASKFTVDACMLEQSLASA
jgi:uncharacterized protein YyaL (SSP411 family)